MGRDDLREILGAGFDATAHLSIRVLEGVIHQAMLEGGILPTTFTDGGGGTLTITLPALTGLPPGTTQATPIPPPPIGAVYPARPANAQALAGELQIATTFTLQSPQLSLVASVVGVSAIQSVAGNAVVTVLPYVVPATGTAHTAIGFDFHQIAFVMTGAVPALTAAQLAQAEQFIAPFLGGEVTLRLLGLRLPLPAVDGREVAAVTYLPAPPGGEPAQLVLAFGPGDAARLVSLLDAGDDVAIAVSSAEFDRRVARETADLPRLTVSDDGTLTSLKRLSMRLIDNGVHISGALDAYTQPRAEVTFSGPLRPRVVNTGIDAQIAFDSDDLDVDVDVDDFFEVFVVSVMTLFTAGIGAGIGLAIGAGVGAAIGAGIGASVGFGGTEIPAAILIGDAEASNRGELGDEIGGTLARSLLRSFPSGTEILGRDELVTRIAAVPWAGVNAFTILPEGFLMGGTTLAGLRYSARTMPIARVHRQDGSLRHYLFLEANGSDGFWLRRADAIRLLDSSRFRIPGVQIVRRRRGEYLRDRREAREYPVADPTDNLAALPTFPVPNTQWPDASQVDPRDPTVRFVADGPGAIRALPPPPQTA